MTFKKFASGILLEKHVEHTAIICPHYRQLLLCCVEGLLLKEYHWQPKVNLTTSKSKGSLWISSVLDEKCLTLNT